MTCLCITDTLVIAVSAIDVFHFDREYLIGFVTYLDKERRNKATTINNRLAAIHSFLRFIAEEAPEYCAIATRGMAVPLQKHDIPAMAFIAKEEFESLLSICDTTNPIGSMDKLMLLILYNTGVRVSGLTGLRCLDIIEGNNTNRTCIKVFGKGRKERVLPLWKTTSSYLGKYLKDSGLNGNDRLFKGRNGGDLTRSGIRSRIDKLVNDTAAAKSVFASCHKDHRHNQSQG